MEMRKLFATTIFAGATMLFLSCSQERLSTTNKSDKSESRVEVKFASGISDMPSRVGGTNGTNWDIGDPVGIYMIGASGALTSSNVIEGAGNKKYTASGGGGGSFSPSTGNTIYYPATGDVKFVAYYPYNASVGNDFKVPVNVTVQNNQSAIDVLYAPAGTTYNKSSGTAQLPFSHKLVKLVFTINPGDGVTAASLNGLTLAIGGQQTSGTLDLTDGTVASSGMSGDITALSAANGRSSEAIVLPRSTTSGVSFTFVASGVTYEGSIPAGNTTWAGGYRYSYIVTLQNNIASVISGTIEPWEDGDTWNITGNGI